MKSKILFINMIKEDFKHFTFNDFLLFRKVLKDKILLLTDNNEDAELYYKIAVFEFLLKNENNNNKTNILKKTNELYIKDFNA